MTISKILIISAGLVSLAACGNLKIDEVGQIAKIDNQVDAYPEPVAGAALAGATPYIYVDGNGCEKWLIDDGVEGYMTTRFVNNRPYCPEGNTPFTIKGDFRDNRYGG